MKLIMEQWRRYLNEAKALPYIAPAQDLEQATGITGISTSYKLPAGYRSEEEVQNKMVQAGAHVLGASEPQAQQLIKTLYDEFTQLNPVLSEIPIGGAIDQYNVVLGAISKFSPPDISFYMKLAKKGAPYAAASQIPGWKETYDAIESEAGFDIGWVPSPGTLRKIKDQLGME